MLNRALFLLYFRRSVPVGLVAFGVLLLGLVALFADPPQLSLIGTTDELGAARAFRMELMWTAAAVAFLSVIVLRASGIAQSWQTKELDWIACRPTSMTRTVASAWLGTVAGGLLAIALTMVVIEGTAGRAGSSGPLAYGGRLEAQELERDENGTVRWQVADPNTPQGSLLRVDLTLGRGSGPSADVVFRAMRSGEERTQGARLVASGRIELEVPPGDGAVTLELQRIGDGARVLFRDPSCELWIPVTSMHTAGRNFGLHAALALAAWLALAFGLGAWMSGPFTVMTMLSVWLGIWLADAPSVFVPGATLPAALEILRAGRAPGAIEASAVIGSSACILAGLGAAILRLRWKGRAQ